MGRVLKAALCRHVDGVADTHFVQAGASELFARRRTRDGRVGIVGAEAGADAIIARPLAAAATPATSYAPRASTAPGASGTFRTVTDAAQIIIAEQLLPAPGC